MTNIPASSHFKIDGRARSEFAEDVLAKLQSRRVSFRKCKPNYVSLKVDGSVEVHFTGERDHKPWQGVVKFNCPFPPDKLMLADPAVVADICEQGVQLMDVT